MGARLASTRESQPLCRRPRAPPRQVQPRPRHHRAEPREGRLPPLFSSPFSLRPALGAPGPSPISLRGPSGTRRGGGWGGGVTAEAGWRVCEDSESPPGCAPLLKIVRGGWAGRIRREGSPQATVEWIWVSGGARDPKGGVGDRAGAAGEG